MKAGRCPDIFGLAKQCKYPCAVVIGTNCMIKKNGRAVMGAGIAAQAQIYDKNVDANLASLIRNNYPAVTAMGIIGEFKSDKISESVRIINFPTKIDWRDNADIDLIYQSAYNLSLFAKQHPEIEVFLLHKLGCGCGRLNFADVYPVLNNILTENKFKLVLRPDDPDIDNI